ncbi:hypothetical protein AX16_004261 [Volvariella volvacea WC 439]|nr:hypothetical protein AX16_004261 [Volvariella volvacea WC 439]
MDDHSVRSTHTVPSIRVVSTSERHSLPRLRPPASRVGRRFTFAWSLWLYIPSLIRFWVYNLLWLWGSKRYGRTSINAQKLPFNLYAKYGNEVRYSEAAAMQYVAESTSIPIPIALDAVWGRNGVFILMTTLPGVPFGKNYVLSDLPADDQMDFEDTIKGWLRQLRSLPIPSSNDIYLFGDPNHNSVRILEALDSHLPNGVAESDSSILIVVPGEYQDGLRANAGLSGLSNTHYRLCFTHGNLDPNNLYFENGQLTGIVNWERAGWYPEYWEYIRIMYRKEEYTLWWNMFRRMFPRYERELELERAAWKVQ